MSGVEPRRTQMERSANTQQKLAQAAFELIRDSGYANFRVAAAARHARVSQGGQLHHFPTKDSLTKAAIEYALGLAVARTERNLDAYRGDRDIVSAIADDCCGYYFSPSFDVAMDVTKGVGTNTEMRQWIAGVHRAYRDFAEEGWLDRLLALGWPRAEADDLIALTASLVRGLAIRAMIRPDEKPVERLLERWRTIARATFDGRSFQT